MKSLSEILQTKKCLQMEKVRQIHTNIKIIHASNKQNLSELFSNNRTNKWLEDKFFWREV